MKANEAPKKIFLFENPITETSDDRWLSQRSDENDIEYIRKDVFIEKAEKWLKEHVLEYAPELNFGVWKTDYDYYTKHFIKDFKKYMEE